LKTSTSTSSNDPLKLLAGTSLRVYLYMLMKGKPIGVRELQRAMGFRSPSTARHHLERLVELGLAVKLPEGYKAIPPRGGPLSLYIYTKGYCIPRLIAIAAALTCIGALLPALYSLVAPGVVCLALSGLLWYEVLRLYRWLKDFVSPEEE